MFCEKLDRNQVFVFILIQDEGNNTILIQYNTLLNYL